jgi:hypothetical protein
MRSVTMETLAEVHERQVAEAIGASLCCLPYGCKPEGVGKLPR